MVSNRHYIYINQMTLLYVKSLYIILIDDFHGQNYCAISKIMTAEKW